MSKTIGILLLALSLFALVSCTDAIDMDLSSWSETTPGYQVFYDNETSAFSSDCDYVVFLEKTLGKDFVILNLADIQIGVLELPKRSFFIRTLDELVRRVSPDLITFTGDFGDYGESISSLKMVSEMLDSTGIPWAPVFGNHDQEISDLRVKCFLLENNCKNCLFRTGPENLGLGNYVINIVEDGSLVDSLIMMNSGNHKSYTDAELQMHAGETPYNRHSSWGCLSDAQIKWYKWAVRSAQDCNPSVKSQLFVHIPIFVYVTATNEAFKGSPDIYDEADFRKYTSSISYEESFNPEIWNPGYEDSFGVFHDVNVGCCNYDDHVFDAIREMGSTDTVVCGHDHTNNTVIKYDGVTLVYGTKTGIGSYWEKGLNGGTVVTIGDSGTTVRHELVI